MTLSAAIIGCGRIAGGYDREAPNVDDADAWSATHAGGYLLCPETNLIAAADPSEDARTEFRNKWSCDSLYADHHRMLAEQMPDIISICAPTRVHAEVFDAVVATKAKGILLEKPIAATLVDAERILHTAGDVPVVVNFSRRFNPTYAEIATNLQTGVYGRILNAVFRYTKGMVVNGSHHIDTARWFFGDVVEVEHLKTHVADHDDPGVDFSLSFENGLHAYFLHVPDADFVFFDVELITEKGRLRIVQRGQQMAFDEAVPEPHFGLFNIIGPKHTAETEWRNCTTRAVQNIAACVNDGAQPQCTLDDGIQVMRIINTLHKAS